MFFFFPFFLSFFSFFFSFRFSRELKSHVVGVQESCIKGNVTREQQKIVAYTSGANGKGQLGVEAWVHRSVLMSPFAGPQD